MIDLILTHSATYLFLIWLLVVGVGNLWPRRKATCQRFESSRDFQKRHTPAGGFDSNCARVA